MKAVTVKSLLNYLRSIGSRTTSQLSNNGATLDTNGSAYMNWTQVKSIPMPIQANDSSVQNQLSSSIYDVPSTKTHNGCSIYFFRKTFIGSLN